MKLLNGLQGTLCSRIDAILKAFPLRTEIEQSINMGGCTAIWRWILKATQNKQTTEQEQNGMSSRPQGGKTQLGYSILWN
jgi:hypothetical protein